MSHALLNHTRRGFVTILVLAAVAMLTVIVIGVQRESLRQASMGREQLALVRAKWAARAGLEATIAELGRSTEEQPTGDAFGLASNLSAVSTAELEGARFSVMHDDNGTERFGPADAHAKININLMTAEDLLLLPGMTEDVAGAIIDWIDTDEVVSPFGAEAGFYAQLDSPYEPRNGPVRSLIELELVAGVDPLDLRGEDWNLNGRLDPNEDDGDLTWPPDDRNGRLDAGWSAFITAESSEPTLNPLGEPLINIAEAGSAAELSQAVQGLTTQQGNALIWWASNDGEARLGRLLTEPLQNLARDSGYEDWENVPPMDEDQLRDVFDNLTLFNPGPAVRPGRMNLNTVSRETLDYVASLPSGQADFLIYLRNNAGGGFTNWVDAAQSLGAQRAVQVSELFVLEPATFVVSSQGVDLNSGRTVQITATIERLTLPITISEMMVR